MINDEAALLSMEKESLIQIIVTLNKEIEKKNDDFMKLTNLRLYHLERSHNMFLQYNRRESFEVSGIPKDIPQERLEDEIVEIVKEAKVSVNRQPLKKCDIVACHRIGRKGNVVCRVINRKFSREAIVNGKNLKGTKRYGDSKIFINSSFCPEFRFLNYACRKAAEKKEIHRYKVKNGVNLVQVKEEEPFHEIGHVNDLENLGVGIPPRSL